MIRVGILGAGFIGGIHAKNLRRDDRVRLVGIADVVPQAAKALASQVDTEALGSLGELLERGADAVYVCTPNRQHVEPVLTGLREKIHVFSEKPMATTLAEARQIRDAARTAGVVYQLGLNRRFARVYRFVKRLIDDGRLRPLLAQMKHNRGELQQPPWTGDPSVTGGYLYETPVHLFDLARFFFGDVEEVSGLARQSVYREPDGFLLIFRFRSGVAATVTSVAHTSWFFPSERIEVYGPHQTAVTEELERAWFSPGMRDQVEGLDVLQMPFEEKWGYVEEDRRFVDAVLGESAPPVTAEDGYRVTELVEAVYQAVRGTAAVRLPLPEP